MEVQGTSFVDLVKELREEYTNQNNLFRYWRESCFSKTDSQRTCLQVWYGPDRKPTYYVCIRSKAGTTLASSLLQFRCDLPAYDKNLEITGDEWHETEFVTLPAADLAEEDDDFEDCSVELATIPLISPSESLHFTKKPSYRSEIQNLELCQDSLYVVKLCGRTSEGDLVFLRHKEDMFIHSLKNAHLMTISYVRRFLLHLIDAVRYLHSRGIIHRDLVLRNLLFSSDPERSVVLADLQSRWGSGPCLAPECWEQKNFTFQSGIYAIGWCLAQFIVAQNPRHAFVKYIVPPPFDIIHAACTVSDPAMRPSLEELYVMVSSIVEEFGKCRQSLG